MKRGWGLISVLVLLLSARVPESTLEHPMIKNLLNKNHGWISLSFRKRIRYVLQRSDFREDMVRRAWSFVLFDAAGMDSVEGRLSFSLQDLLASPNLLWIPHLDGKPFLKEGPPVSAEELKNFSRMDGERFDEGSIWLVPDVTENWKILFGWVEYFPVKNKKEFQLRPLAGERFRDDNQRNATLLYSAADQVMNALLVYMAKNDGKVPDDPHKIADAIGPENRNAKEWWETPAFLKAVDVLFSAAREIVNEIQFASEKLLP
ncbi:MAG: hypothetical protein V2G33_07235 [bacterium JZ-2024 1]